MQNKLMLALLISVLVFVNAPKASDHNNDALSKVSLNILKNSCADNGSFVIDDILYMCVKLDNMNNYFKTEEENVKPKPKQHNYTERS